MSVTRSLHRAAMLVVLAAASFSAQESRPFSLMVGDSAPQLRVDRWLKGSLISEYRRGHVYVVEFWATWCGPCKECIPHLSKLQEKYPDKVTIVGISVWEPRDQDVDPFVKDWDARMRYTVAADKVVGVDTADEEQRVLEAKGESRDDEEEARWAELSKLLFRD